MAGKMIKVCQKWFPHGTYKNQRGDGFLMNEILKSNLDIYLKNITKDWSFTIIISGGGKVRVGKSVLAMQIASYWAYQLKELYGITVPFNIEDNFVFYWEDLIENSNRVYSKTGRYFPMIYDEAGESLEGTKVLSSETKAVNDYLRECGQYNSLNILVLPEFFVLPRPIAVNYSDILINVFVETGEDEIFQRGYAKFYSSMSKRRLFRE